MPPIVQARHGGLQNGGAAAPGKESATDRRGNTLDSEEHGCLPASEGQVSGAEAGSVLARLAFFRGANPGALAAAAPHARCLNVERNETVLDFGDPTDDVFLIAEGLVRVVVRTPQGSEFILGDLGPGEIFGEMAAIDVVPRSANVTALHRTQLCRMPASAFLDLALSARVVTVRLMRVLTGRLRLQSERMAEMTTLSVRLRLAAELLRLSRLRGAGSERILSPPPQQHVLAARIGARRETVSLALSDLVREGLVQVSSRAIVLTRPDALRATIEAHLRGDAPSQPHAGQRKAKLSG
jgi:CRP/FNR family cyclic AMP-dependent transcriptional regulator